jgi:hypothetical protein
LIRLSFAIAAVALASSAWAEPPAPEDGWQKVEVVAKAVPISRGRGTGTHVGSLIFRGGLELTSRNPMFGGWSGIEMDGDDRFVAISDQGSFLSGALTINAAGDLTGVSETKIGVMRDEKGEPLDGKSWQDAEDIAHLADGRYAVSFERHHRILIYDLAKNGPLGAAEKGPPVPQDMEENEGIEALTQAPDGDLIAGREFSATREQPTEFYKLKLDGGGMIAGPARIREHYALVAIRPLPDGDYIALERFYLPLIGMRAAIKRFNAAGLADAEPSLDGPQLAQLKKPLEVDNFEGLAVVPRKDGGVRIYIISDDNFSPTQRTLLYAFDLPNPKTGTKAQPKAKAKKAP